jgi:hypothetical protein
MPVSKAIHDTLLILNSSSVEVSQAVITSIMNLHIIPGILYSKDLVFDTAQEITTGLPKSNLIINTGISMSIAGQGNKALGQVVEMDTIVRGGTIHWIDTTLLPDLSILANIQQKDVTILPIFE